MVRGRRLAILLTVVGAFIGPATSRALDQPIDAVKLVLQRSATGKQKLVFLSDRHRRRRQQQHTDVYAAGGCASPPRVEATDARWAAVTLGLRFGSEGFVGTAAFDAQSRGRWVRRSRRMLT